MKKYNLLTLAILAIASTLTITSCLKDEVVRPETVTDDPNGEQFETRGSILKKSTQTTFGGTSTKTLTQEWWKYVLSLDCEGNPVNDGTVLTASKQFGKVVFLGGINQDGAEEVVEITRGQVLLVPIINFLSSPCDVTNISPDLTLGQVYKDGATKVIGEANILKASLDGNPIKIGATNRITSDLFSFTANKDLANCFDPCINGELQLAVSDGYWLALQYLTRGKHVLHVHGEIEAYGIINDVTYYINVY